MSDAAPLAVRSAGGSRGAVDELSTALRAGRRRCTGRSVGPTGDGRRAAWSGGGRVAIGSDVLVRTTSGRSEMRGPIGHAAMVSEIGLVAQAVDIAVRIVDLAGPSEILLSDGRSVAVALLTHRTCHRSTRRR